MAESLTKEAIDGICQLIAENKMIEAIRALRTAWPFGLKEAKDFLDGYKMDSRDSYFSAVFDIISLRKRLYQMANIKEGAIFENSYFRVELKQTGASFLEAHRFLTEVLSKLDLHPDSQEIQEAFMEMADLFLTEISFEEINELCARLMKHTGFEIYR